MLITNSLQLGNTLQLLGTVKQERRLSQSQTDRSSAGAVKYL